MLTRNRCMIVMCALAMMFGGLVSSARAEEKPAHKVEFRLAESKPTKGTIEAVVAETKRKIYVYPKAELTHKDVESAKVLETDGVPRIGFELTKAGAAKMKKMTSDNQGKELAVLLDGKVLVSARIASAIGKSGIITGDFSKAQVKAIVEAFGGK